MSKARTLANLISDNAELADGQISVAEVVGAAPTANPTFTGVVGATTISSPTLNATINLKTTDANGEGIGLGIDADKKVRFYDDQGASTKMYWNASTATQKFEDSSKIAFGSSEDLKIYHSQTTGNNIDLSSNPLQIKQLGANSVAQFHKNSTGHGPLLQFYNNGASHGAISTDNNQFILSADGELLIRSGGGSLKLATTSTGIDVTGTVSSDGLSVDGTITADNFTNVDLTAIAKDISDTAVDVFVYDTSKDSDGGAWRKRTQNTSWYNEAASATRGSRKEFPAVAVIVAESNQVTIYDGDDPDLPMWMVFNQGNQYQIYTNDNNLSSIQMLNGKLCWAGFRIGRIDFIKDASDALELSYYVKFTNPISGRNTANYSYEASAFSIVNNSTNDVAMTVLPNAPIDSATGLPVPTIAVATAGGTSIIRDDGTVVDYTLGNYPIKNVEFDFDNNVLQSSRNIGSGGGALYVNKYPIISADSNTGTVQQELVLSSTAGDNTGGLDFVKTPFIEGTKNLVALKDSTLAFSSDAGAVQGIGVYQLGPDGTTKTTTLGAVVTSDYNTGWMNGDIKLATLSDTDDTDVTATNHVTNGDFTSNITGWNSAYNGALSHSSGKLKVTRGSTSLYGVTQSVSGLTAGRRYLLFATVNSTATTPATRLQVSGVGLIDATAQNTTSNADVFLFQYFTATSTNHVIEVLEYGSDSTSEFFTIDNVGWIDLEEDRSVNNNGLQVFGTVTKTPVATGADLMAYSGFSSGNYLEQPYNSDLQFGTGDFCFSYWVKFSSIGGESIYSTVGTGTSSGTEGVAANTAGSGVLGFAVYTNGIQSSGRTNCGFTTTPSVGVWHCVQNLRRGGTLELWIDGVMNGTAANTSDINATDSFTRLGGWSNGGVGDSTSLALFRVSKTAPSPEQIAKIYEDEKVLFQENAKATLYGTSDAVTALAHDDTTDLLHVGTSAGRSVFQGLRRVDNTTTAVGAAISASNGLVAED